MSKWSLADFTTAYEEARNRLTERPVRTSVKVNMDSSGMMTVGFTSSVKFPSYLLKSV